MNPPYINKNSLIAFGFYELPHMTVTNALLFDLPNNKKISVGCIGTPNEMVWICEHDKGDKRKITDMICFRNFDYHGYTKESDLFNLISLLKNISII